MESLQRRNTINFYRCVSLNFTDIFFSHLVFDPEKLNVWISFLMTILNAANSSITEFGFPKYSDYYLVCYGNFWCTEIEFIEYQYWSLGPNFKTPTKANHVESVEQMSFRVLKKITQKIKLSKNVKIKPGAARRTAAPYYSVWTLFVNWIWSKSFYFVKVGKQYRDPALMLFSSTLNYFIFIFSSVRSFLFFPTFRSFSVYSFLLLISFSRIYLSIIVLYALLIVQMCVCVSYL